MIQILLTKIELSLLSYLKSDNQKIVDAIKEYVSDLAPRLSELMAFMQGSDPDKLQFLFARLKNEQQLIKSQFLSLVLLAEADVEDVTNNIFGILIRAII